MLFIVSVANIFNLGADIGAMGAATQLVLPGELSLFVVIFGVGSLVGVLLVPYSTYAKYLKWLTVSLFAYVGVVFFAHVSWPAVIRSTFLPHIELTKAYLTALVAVLGTTISPYLFFWQASQEVEEIRSTHGEKPLKRAPSQAKAQLERIRVDTYLGMALSNLVAFFIILTAGATLHAHGSGDRNLCPGREGIGAHRRSFCIPAVCLGYCRHRLAGGSGTGGIGVLRNWRSLPMENKPRAQASGCGPILRGDYRRDPDRPVSELHAH